MEEWFMKKLILLFLLIPTLAYARFYPGYMEMDVISRVVKVGEKEEARYVCDVPIERQPLILVFVDGVNYYAYPLPASTEGKECLAHVVYHSEDDKAMQKFAGKLGAGNKVTKLAEYKAIVQKSVSEAFVESEKAKIVAEATAKGEIASKEDLDKVSYKGEGGDDGIPLWVFQTKEYIDK